MPKKNDKKSLDWTLKNFTDSAHIEEKLKKRNTKTSPAKTVDQQCAKGEALEHLHQNVTEIFDAPEDENDEFKPFFNISLIDDENETDNELAPEKKHQETLRITKEQQMAGKLNVIMSSAITADAAGLPSEITAKDRARVNSAEYDVAKLRRQTKKEKISEPLELDGEIPEDELAPSVSGIKKAKKNLPDDSLKDFPAEELFELDQEDDPNALAKLILEKTGRKIPKTKKKLSDIAKDLNRLDKDGIGEQKKKEDD